MLTGKEGSYSVVGRGAAVIYINNRKITDATEIERLNSSDIKDVEVVTNPGARYDATMSAVIRIHTVRKVGDGSVSMYVRRLIIGKTGTLTISSICIIAAMAWN